MTIRRTAAVAAVLFGFLLAACDAGDIEIHSPVEITVAGMFGGSDSNAQIFNRAVEEYTELTGNPVVNMSVGIADTAWEMQVINDFSTGSEADVIQFFTGPRSDPIVTAGKLVSIDDIRREYPEYADNVADVNLSYLASGVDGKTYVVPTNGYWEGMFVNVDLLESCGLSVPGTWEELIYTCEILKKNGITPIGLAVNDIPHYVWEFFLYNYTDSARHGFTIPQKTGDAAYNAYVNALKDIKFFYDSGYFTPHSLTVRFSETQAGFYNKRSAFYLDGNWARAGIESGSTDVSKVRLAVFPTKNKDRNFFFVGFSSGFMITRKAWDDAERREACVRFIETVTSDKYLAEFAGASANPSKNKMELPKEIVTPLLAQCVEVINEADTYAITVQDNWTAAAKEYMFNKGIGEVCEGKISPETCVEIFMSKNN